MKARIFLYLFLFALMYSIFQFVNTKRYAEKKEEEIENLEVRIQQMETDQELKAMKAEEDEMDGFTLSTNSYAREFFEEQEIEIDSLLATIENELISRNSIAKDNPLVPYSGTGDRPMNINRLKVLNNRWIIAEFTDGISWGEALISYFIDEKDELQFDTLDSVLYSN